MILINNARLVSGDASVAKITRFDSEQTPIMPGGVDLMSLTGSNIGERNGKTGPLPITRSIYGAGVIVDAERGLALAADHVVKGAEAVSVLLSDVGRRFVATTVMRDEDSDLAILKIDATS